MPTIDIRGAELHYTEQGQGEPVVLVHGSASDRRTWRAQESAFGRRFRTIAYSRRYHWPNALIAADETYAMEEQVEDLKALLAGLDVAPAHLVGHSYGAFLCLLVAMEEPALVRSLALTEPPVTTLFVSPMPRPLEILRLGLRRPRTAAAMAKFGARGLKPAAEALEHGRIQNGVRTFGDAVFGEDGFAALPEERKGEVYDNVTNIKAELLGPGFAPLDPDSIRGLRRPTLLVSGGDSIPLFRYLTDALGELIGHARREEIPNAGHMVHEEEPEAYNAAVLAFLEAQAMATATKEAGHERQS